MKNHYKCAILGATFEGVGAFLASANDSILIEPSASAGYEFIDSYAPGSPWVLEDSWSDEPFILEFYKNLESRNLIFEGRVHLAGVGPLLFDAINKSSGRSLFYTSIVSVVKNNDVFEFKLFNRSGFIEITADKILDTTSQFISRSDFKPDYSERSMNVLLETKNDANQFTVNSDSKAKIYLGRFEKEAYLSLALLNGESIAEARLLFHNFWTSKENEFKKYFDVLSTSVRLRELPLVVESQSDWVWSPSILKKNSLEALYAGLKSVVTEEPILA